MLVQSTIDNVFVTDFFLLQDEIFSSSDTIPDVQCPYIAEERTCTPLVIEMPGAAMSIAAGVGGLMVLSLATLCALIF